MANPLKIFVSACETSGDLHGANLVRALRRLAPGAEIAALGGPRIQDAGARLVANTADFGVIGLAPLLAAFGKYAGLLKRADRFLTEWRPDVAVTIDNPGFHFLLGRRLRARGIPALWYIPPQVWAWAPWRVRKLRKRFARVACILPHEEKFFRDHGVPAVFVGNPVVDHLRSLALDQDFIGSLRRAPHERLIALLPGSRRQEVEPILGRQLVVARALAARHPPCRFVLALAAEEHLEWAKPALAEGGGDLEIRTVVGKTHEVQQAADLALAKSGTTTLELLYYGTPMAVFYNISRIQWRLVGRWLLQTPYLAMPNVLAGRRIVPEYMWHKAPSAAEIDEVARLLADDARRKEVRAAFSEIRRTIDRPGAAENAAREVLGLAATQ